MEVVRVKNLSKVYGTEENLVYALKGVELSIEKGEFVAIKGTSGSGKSTLLHILGGIDSPTEGRVWINGQEITGMKDEERTLFRRENIGFIYQFFNLIPVLNVEENILLPARLMDKKSKLPQYFLKELGLEERKTHLPSQLSGGQQQRVAIARALITRPSIILADEPTGNLDKKNTWEIMKLLKICNKKYNQTIVVVTHDEKVAQMCDRIIYIEDGRWC